MGTGSTLSFSPFKHDFLRYSSHMAIRVRKHTDITDGMHQQGLRFNVFLIFISRETNLETEEANLRSRGKLCKRNLGNLILTSCLAGIKDFWNITCFANPSVQGNDGLAAVIQRLRLLEWNCFHRAPFLL